MPDCVPIIVAVAVAAAVAAIVFGGTLLWVDFERNWHTARNRTVVAVVAIVAAADRHRPHLGDYPGGLDGTATYSGISGPNAAPSPITYHPCANTARRNVLVAYRLIYELPENSPSSSHSGELCFPC